MRFILNENKGTYKIVFTPNSFVELTEVIGEGDYIFTICLDKHNEVYYQETFNMGERACPHVMYEDIAINNPFWDESYCDRVNPIKYYGENFFYEWLTKVLMSVCLPQCFIQYPIGRG